MCNTNISISEDREKRRRRMKTRGMSDDSTGEWRGRSGKDYSMEYDERKKPVFDLG